MRNTVHPHSAAACARMAAPRAFSAEAALNSREGAHSKKPPIGDFARKRKKMVKNLELAGVSDRLALSAMEFVPRHLFVPPPWDCHAYENMALPIGYGQTISQPLVVAKMLEYSQLEKGMRVLEIGMGSGYQTALLAAMGCVAYGVERLSQLCKTASARLRELGFRRAMAHCADGTLGLPEAAPYDRIIVAAGGPEIPSPLIAQMENDGAMIIPIGPTPRLQRLCRIRKLGGRLFKEDLGPATFVDLVGRHGWTS